jgi:hypothetical protein
MTHLLLHKTPNLVSSEPGAAQQALNETRGKLEPLGIYQETDHVVREAKLFAELSRFITDGAHNKERLNELAYEKGLIGAEMQMELMRGI